MMTTQLVDNRDVALLVGYAATDWKTSVPFDVYRAAMSDWVVKEIRKDNQTIGAAYRKDDEVHVSILPEWRRLWATRGVLRQLFEGPKVTTRVTPGHDYMYDILKRLGFKELGDGLFVKENQRGH
jgi:hypothetical protein